MLPFLNSKISTKRLLRMDVFKSADECRVAYLVLVINLLEDHSLWATWAKQLSQFYGSDAVKASRFKSWWRCKSETRHAWKELLLPEKLQISWEVSRKESHKFKTARKLVFPLVKWMTSHDFSLLAEMSTPASKMRKHTPKVYKEEGEIIYKISWYIKNLAGNICNIL